jgi:nitrite reductase (NADH) small subunit
MFIETTPREQTYNLGPVGQIPIGEGRTFQVGALALAVFRLRTGDLFATQATCPHKGGPVADGIVGAGKVICPLHAYRFELATGQPVGNDCSALKTYPVCLTEDGELLLKLNLN